MLWFLQKKTARNTNLWIQDPAGCQNQQEAPSIQDAELIKPYIKPLKSGNPSGQFLDICILYILNSGLLMWRTRLPSLHSWESKTQFLCVCSPIVIRKMPTHSDWLQVFHNVSYCVSLSWSWTAVWMRARYWRIFQHVTSKWTTSKRFRDECNATVCVNNRSGYLKSHARTCSYQIVPVQFFRLVNYKS